MDSQGTSARTRRRPSGPPSRKLDPEGVKQDILDVATEEFANHGLSGARVDAIAARTRTAKHMIYYYFGSKEGLFLAVLEQSYARMRAAERELELDQLPPPEAIQRMVEFVFDYQEAHPDFTRLVSIENIHWGKHVAQSSTIQKLRPRRNMSPFIARITGHPTGWCPMWGFTSSSTLSARESARR